MRMLRSSTVEYLEAFDAKSWHEDPVRTLLRGRGVGVWGLGLGL